MQERECNAMDIFCVVVFANSPLAVGDMQHAKNYWEC